MICPLNLPCQPALSLISVDSAADLDQFLADNPCARDVAPVQYPKSSPGELFFLVATYATPEQCAEAKHLATISALTRKQNYHAESMARYRARKKK